MTHVPSPQPVQRTAVVTATIALCDELLRGDLPPAARAQVIDARTRLDGPLRVAIAGRIKAGKSTLLNALVGERLAPTDAQECTRIVTDYREALGYDVAAELRDGSTRPLEFTRTPALEMELGPLRIDDVERIRVGWPAERLRSLTLVDTPGLASVNDDVSARTTAVLSPDHGAPDADAVIYLMRHLHRIDADFLEGFTAGSGASASPVNSLAVLSRADEVGAGRLDAMDSARRVAAAYAGDARIAAMSGSVIAVAGLLAETAQTLAEDEYRTIAALAGLSEPEREQLLLSADRVAGHDLDGVERATGVTAARRVGVVRRFGLFGTRIAIDVVVSGRAASTAQLASRLLEESGVEELRRRLSSTLAPRSEVLRARSALTQLASIADQLPESQAAVLRSALERVIAGAHEFAELRLAHLVASGSTRLTSDDAARAQRLATAGAPARRLGLDPDTSSDVTLTAAYAEIGHWRQLAANPLLDPVSVEACAIATRTVEGLLPDVTR